MSPHMCSMLCTTNSQFCAEYSSALGNARPMLTPGVGKIGERVTNVFLMTAISEIMNKREANVSLTVANSTEN